MRLHTGRMPVPQSTTRSFIPPMPQTGHSTPAACPICSAPSRAYCTKHAFGKDWPILRCTAKGCRHGFVFPRPTLSDVTAANADETARSDFAAPQREPTMARQDVRSLVNTLDRLARVRGRSLDIGAGDGSFSMGLSTVGFAPHMIDLDPRGQLATTTIPNSTFAADTFEGLQDRGPFGLILMSQVLEHALDPLDWLRRSADLLVPGGMIVIALPNFGGVYRLLGERDPYLIPPIHVNFFTPGSLRRALEATGFAPARIDSNSHTTPRRADGRVGAKRLVLSALMELARPLLDPPARGIILRAFAHRTP